VSATRTVKPVLLFEFGGTLDADGIAWKDRFYRIWREEVEDIPRETFERAFHAADDALVGNVPRGLSLSGTVDRLGRGLSAELGADPASADRAARRFSRESLAVLQSRSDLLARLSENFRLGIVSNFYGNLDAACEEAGIAGHFETAIDSVDVGCVKPDPRIFRAALDALDAGPADAIFIGDSTSRDMAGARSLGMRHVLVAGAAGAVPDGCCPGDRVIRRLDELPAVLA